MQGITDGRSPSLNPCNHSPDGPSRPATTYLIQDPPCKHSRTAAVYEKYCERRDEREVINRKDAVRLSQIRLGHSCAFKAYQHLLDCSVDPTCPDCSQAPHTLEHWFLECPALQQARQDIFECQDLSLNVLGSDPQKVIALAERTLF